MGAPAYAWASPVTVTASPSRHSPSGGFSSTKNLGRLYSSTRRVALPGGSAVTSRMAPSSRPVGAVQVPLKEPKSLVTKSALAISWSLTSRKARVTVRRGRTR